MPAIDPTTGKPLSGAAKRRRRAERVASLLPEAPGANPFEGFPEPPLTGTPVDVEAWGAQLGAVALEAAGRGEDPCRVAWVVKSLRRLGQLKDRARHSAKAVVILREFRKEHVDLLSDERPAHVVAVVAWAYYRMARTIHEAATSSAAWGEEAEARFSPIVEAAAALGYLPQVQAIRELTARLRKEAEASGRARA